MVEKILEVVIRTKGDFHSGRREGYTEMKGSEEKVAYKEMRQNYIKTW